MIRDGDSSDELKPQIHPLARQSNGGIQQSNSKPKPITRAQRAELEKANRIDLELNAQENAADRRGAAIESLKVETAKLDQQFDLAEAEHARDLVDEVIPAYAQWRAKQSASNIAQHISAYGEEVAEDLLPKFRGYSEALSSDLREVAASVVSSFGAA